MVWLLFAARHARIGQNVRWRSVSTQRRACCKIPEHFFRNAVLFERMPDKSPAQIPSKLRARRVRVHVATTLAHIRRFSLRREAVQCRQVGEVSWASLDLYTIALDICEDDQTRDLVAQARGTIITRLMQR
jgi:hypothetical protein